MAENGDTGTLNEAPGHRQSVERGGAQVPPAMLRLWERRGVFGPFAVAGAVSVIAGGVLAAAIAAPAPTRHGVWAAAFLVLVTGVGQLVLGAGQALLPAVPPAAGVVVGTAVAFNLANFAVLMGVVGNQLAVLDAGALLLVIALVMFLRAVRRGARPGWPLYAYRLLVAVLVVSIPIGVFLTTTTAR